MEYNDGMSRLKELPRIDYDELPIEHQQIIDELRIYFRDWKFRSAGSTRPRESVRRTRELNHMFVELLGNKTRISSDALELLMQSGMTEVEARMYLEEGERPGQS